MSNKRDFFIFTISGNFFALPLSRVDSVVRTVELLHLPEATPGLLGLLDLHGALIPVLDVNARLNLSAAEITIDRRLVIARHGERTVAFIVDAVEPVVSMAQEELTAGEEIYPQMDKFVQAIIWRDKQKILLCDPLEFLSLADYPAFDEVTD